jgi:hypothetical protein
MKYAVKDWWEIAPVEDVPWHPAEGDDREAFVQVFDAAAAEAMHAAFQNRKANQENFVGLLIDWDHESTDLSKRTTGAGYIVDTKVEGGRLYGRPRLSADGARDVEGGMFRFTSPTIPPTAFADLGGGRKRPLDLDSVAITNRPRCKTLAPISNAVADDAVIRNTDSSAGAEEANRRPAAQTNKPKEKHTMKLTLSESTVAMLLSKLGLNPEEATDESVAAALGEHPGKEDVTAINNRIQSLEAAVVNSDLDAHGITDAAEREKFRPLLIANRDAGLAALGAIKTARAATKPTGLMHNRADAKTPGGTRPGMDVRALRNSAVQAFQITNKCGFEEAWNATRAAKPELFNDNESK